MKQLEMQVISVEKIAKETIEMTLQNEYVAKTAKPGQFLHIQIDGFTLRRPISIAMVDRKQNLITILFKQVGDGTRRLAAYQPGARVNVLGPNGNGFPIDDESLKTILLIGGGIGVPPLYYLGQTLQQQGVQVISILGFQTKDYVFYEDKFRKLGQTYIVTNDGSYGRRGYVTNVLDETCAFDYYYSCGPIPMLKAVTDKLAQKPGSISLEERMGCGVGACYACVIPTDHDGGYKKICQDGPVFRAGEVLL